jgi:hypothetical protein
MVMVSLKVRIGVREGLGLESVNARGLSKKLGLGPVLGLGLGLGLGLEVVMQGCRRTINKYSWQIGEGSG